ncbi:MAG: hypothetical protein AB8B72_01045 [Crocinitomicaceae bacterium]
MKSILLAILLSSVLFGCNKISVEEFGTDYSKFSDNVDFAIKDNRTFSANLEINLTDIDLPNKDIDYELILEISEFDNAYYLEGAENVTSGVTTTDVPEDAIRSKKTIYDLGKYKNEKVSFKDEIKVTTSGKSIVHEAQILLKTIDGKFAYLLSTLAWKSRSLANRSYTNDDPGITNNTGNQIGLGSGILIFPEMFYLTDNQNSADIGTAKHSNILSGDFLEDDAIPNQLSNLNIRGILYDDEFGTVYNNMDNEVRYFNKSNSQTKPIADLDDFYCSVRSGENLYILEQDEKLYRFNTNSGSLSFVKNVDISSSEGNIYPISDYSSTSHYGGAIGHYDLVFFNGVSYLCKTIQNQTKVFVFNDVSIKWDLVQNNQALIENNLDEGYFIQTGNELFLIGHIAAASQSKAFQIIHGSGLQYLGQVDYNNMRTIVRGIGDSGMMETFTIISTEWGGLIKI